MLKLQKKFFKVGHRSRSQVKIFLCEWEALVTRNLHSKYKGSISNGPKVMTNVKVVQPTNQQTNKPANRQGKNNMSPLCYRGHKNVIHYNKRSIAHLSEIATANMQMLCNIFPILSLQPMKGSSFEQFLVLKKKNVLLFFYYHYFSIYTTVNGA